MDAYSNVRYHYTQYNVNAMQADVLLNVLEKVDKKEVWGCSGQMWPWHV